MVGASSISIPPEASGPVLAASRPIRIGPLFWANVIRGATTLAIPAPAAALTNCRRDIGTSRPPVMFPRPCCLLCFLFLGQALPLSDGLSLIGLSAAELCFVLQFISLILLMFKR